MLCDTVFNTLLVDEMCRRIFIRSKVIDEGEERLSFGYHLVT